MSSIFPFDPEEEFGANPHQSTPMVPLDSIQKVRDLEDGSTIYQLVNPNSPSKNKAVKKDFHANLAEEMESAALDSLAARLLDEIKQDRQSRSEWEQSITVAMKYLGFKVEEFRSTPFFQACSAYDSTMATALLRYYATARAELWPATGPAKSQIIGTPTQQSEQEGERVKTFMNYYLTQIDTDYYSESERLLMYVGFMGSAFRKVYQDPVLNRPVSRTINPQNLLINIHTTNINSSTRMTEVMFLTRKEIMLRQRDGFYIKSDIPSISEEMNDEEGKINKAIKRIEGINSDSTENRSLFKYFECHAELSVEDITPDNSGNPDDAKNQLPRPYIVTICDVTRKIVAIRRNWKEEDENFEKEVCYVHYYYLPGFGIYGVGLAHTMGSNAITLTNIQRQLMDAGTLKNFPGGLKEAGLRIENNDKAIGPAEFHEVQTGGRPISDCIMLMPYGEPSQVLMALRKELGDEVNVLGMTAETQLPESGANAPVGTTLAMLEVITKMQSSILRGNHVSLDKELKLLFNLFGKYLPDEPYPFAVPGSSTAIMRQDFNDRISIVPVSDPNVLTSTHRLLKAEALLKLAMSAPEIHDMREAFNRMYQAMDVQNIDKLIVPVQQAIPVDPITENMNMLRGMPLKAGIEQDHPAHITVHMQFTDNPVMAAHIREHQAFDYLIKIYHEMGIPIPNEQQLQDPQVQNEIAIRAAEVISQQQAQQQQQAPLDPNAVMMADIEQRREAAQLKHEESKLRAETEAFKTQMNFESEKAKIEANLEIAEGKNDVTLAIADMKTQPLETK